MRTKDYRIHQRNRIKNKYIQRLKNENWRWHDDAPVDWENLSQHYKTLHEQGVTYFWITDNELAPSAIEACRLFKMMGRDKPWDKSPKWWKQMHQRKRRAEVRDRMANGDYDNIPVFKKDNDWNWT